MRMMVLGAALAASMGWSLESRAQLAPPAPMQPPPGATPAPAWGFPAAQPQQPYAAPNGTQQQLAAADGSKSFRGLEIAWTNLEVGGGYTKIPSKLGYNTNGEGGPVFGLGVGGRFVSWILGVRARVMPTSSFTLLQVMAEAGYHQPVGAWDPYINIRGGYVTAFMKSDAATATIESFGATAVSDSFKLPNLRGGDVGAAVGDDYYVSALFSVGLDVSFDALFFTRPARTEEISQTPPSDAIPVVNVPSASAVGYVVTGSVHAGLHFDL